MMPRELSRAREGETSRADPDTTLTSGSTFAPKGGFPC
jgi:hypothetical protein